MDKDIGSMDACDAPLLELQIQIAAVWNDRKKLQTELKEYRAAFGNQGLLQKLEAENTRLKDFLSDWNGHDKDCAVNGEYFEGCDESGFVCDCGYQKAKDQALHGRKGK